MEFYKSVNVRCHLRRIFLCVLIICLLLKCLASSVAIRLNIVVIGFVLFSFVVVVFVVASYRRYFSFRFCILFDCDVFDYSFGVDCIVLPFCTLIQCDECRI